MKPITGLLLIPLLAVLFAFGSSASFARSTNGNAPWVGDTLDDAPCEGKAQAYGPYDYLLRSKFKENLYLVESAHFNFKVEQLISGAKPNREMEWDLDYTLRAFPNHHRALYAVVRYRLLKGRYAHPNLSPAECYLQRAIYFSPKDGVSHMIYGILLQRTGNKKPALAQYRFAQQYIPHNPQLKYNLGLLLTDLQQYEEARQLAVEVYRAKFPLPGLKNRLKTANQWDESLLKTVPDTAKSNPLSKPN